MAGQVWRYTTAPEPIEVTGRDGDGYTFDAGLSDPAPTQSAANVEGIEIPISVVLGINAWEALAGLEDAGGLTAELALWREGQTWERREVWADGRVDRPVYETEGEAVAFSIIEVAWEDRSLIPSPAQQVSAATWPVTAGTATPDGAVGQFYPYVFGAPGVLLDGDGFTEFFGWPVLLVEVDATTGDNFTGAVTTAAILVAGHDMVASAFILYNRTTGLQINANITRTADAQGQVVAVSYVGGGDMQISDGDELWASCQTVGDGGLQAADGSVLRGAGQIAAWLMARSTLRFDPSKAPMLSRLDAFRMDFFINSPVSAWSILNDTLIQAAAGLLPAFWRRSSGGLYLAVRPWEGGLIDPSSPVLPIQPEIQGGDRDGPVTVSSSGDLRTDLSLDYARDEGLGATRRSLTYSPIPATGATVNPYLSVRFARDPVRQFLRIEAAAIQDPATARLLLDLTARLRATTRRTVRYLLPPDDRLGVGGIVAVTDDEIRWTARLCWITAITVRAEDDFWIVDVEELPDWFRQRGGT